jgi:plasmid maintenance system antidote protein VapI
MSFARVSASLQEYARELVRNGDFTERGLARFLGVSQPHIHNVLKGARPLTPELFDTMLKRLDLDLLDLYPKAEIDLHLARRARNRSGRPPL